MERRQFVISGFSREFLEQELGLKQFIPPPVETVATPVMPLEPIKLACFEKINCGVEQSGSSSGS